MKEERSKQRQTNNKAKQHSTPKAVTFPKKNELPQVGLQPTTLDTLDRVLYQLSYRGNIYMYIGESAIQSTMLYIYTLVTGQLYPSILLLVELQREWRQSLDELAHSLPWLW